MKKTLGFALLTLFLFSAQNSYAKHHVFKSVTVLVGNTKIWVPSHFTVKKGDTVEFKLRTTLKKPSDVHGFAIPSYGIVDTVDNKEKTIKLTANKAGVHEIKCHLHAAHIGGQLVVLD